MATKRHKADEVVMKFHQVEVLHAKGKPMAEASARQMRHCVSNVVVFVNAHLQRFASIHDRFQSLRHFPRN